MKDQLTSRLNTDESFYIELGNKKVSEIKITAHAKKRWIERVEEKCTSYESITEYLWDHLKQKKIELYYTGQEDIYIVDDDLVLVAEFEPFETEQHSTSTPLQRMVVVTILGRMSEILELRDIKSYYSWLRHERRMHLIKNNRKRK